MGARRSPAAGNFQANRCPLVSLETAEGRASGRRLLVIDDEIHVDGPLVRWLTMDGFGVDCAHTGAEGLARALSSPPPDAVVLDLHLPDVLGLTVLSELRRANVDAPVLAVTGWYLDGGHEAAAQALGAAAFCYKPLDGQNLATTLHSAISLGSRPRAAQACAKATPCSNSPRSLPSDGAAEADLLRTLHLHLLNGDEGAADRMFAILVPRLQRALSARFQRVPWDWLHDAVVDALLDYYRSPGRFDPARGVPLRKWLEYPAWRNLLNRFALEQRRSRHETKVPYKDLEACPAPTTNPELDLSNHLRSVLPGCTAVEYAVLRLWMLGERRTSVFAGQAGAAGLPPEEQRVAVKRLKDRLFKRLRRQHMASDRRIRR